MPILHLPSLADKNTYVSQLVSWGTVPPASGHSLTPGTLKPSVAMVNGSALIVYLRNEL